QPGFGLSNTGPFDNLQSSYYWFANVYVPDALAAYDFRFYDGEQSTLFILGSYYSWPVHDGDVGASTVPLPAADWLLGSGLLGMLGTAGTRLELRAGWLRAAFRRRRITSVRG